MPKFDHKPNDDGKQDALVVPQAWMETRCHVCMSKYRKAIDRMIALGTGYTEISRVFGGEIDRRSISNHARKHLAYEEAAVRQIIERESFEAEADAEEGITGAVKRKVLLETYVQKALEQVLGNGVVVEPRDAVVVIEALNKFDNNTSGAQLDAIKAQFNAFIQAIREVAAARKDPSLGTDILIRAREILGVEVSELPQLKA